MTKHTPGPWTCTATSHHAHDYRLGVPGGLMPFIKGQGTEYTNARLISAAPDLLEALENLVILSDVDMKYSSPHFFPWLEKARAAIAKATGETP